MSSLYTRVQFDEGVPFTRTLVDTTTDEPIDLTGKDVTMVYKLNGGEPIEKEMTVVDEAGGIVSYVWEDGDLGEGGKLEIEIVISATGFVLASSDVIKQQVRARLV